MPMPFLPWWLAFRNLGLAAQRPAVVALVTFVFSTYGSQALAQRAIEVEPNPKRIALVIGIDAYPRLPERFQLSKAVADAETMAETLKGLGFAVELARNPDRNGVLAALDRVKAMIAPADTVLFFFAGHGISFQGTNLLLPADMPPIDPHSEALIRGASIAETTVIEDLRSRRAGLTILVLDACRDNPIEEFARRQAAAQGRKFRSGTMRSTGLDARPTSGVFSIYSAGIGQRALDRLASDGRDDRNSVFTRVFAKRLAERGRHLSDLMEDVKDDVAKLAFSELDPETGQPHRQNPAFYNETQGGRVFLAGQAVAVDPPPPLRGEDEIAWSFLESSGSIAQIEDLGRRFPNSKLRKWWEKRLVELRGLERNITVVSRKPESGTQENAVLATKDNIARDGPIAITHDAEVHSIAFSPEGDMVLSGGDNGMLRLWALGSGSSVLRFEQLIDSGPIWSVAFSPNGRLVVTNNLDLRDRATGSLVRRLKDEDRSSRSVAFSPDGELVLHGADTPKLSETNSGDLARTFEYDDRSLISLAFSPDGRFVLSGGEGSRGNKVLKLWNARTGRLLRYFSGHSDAVLSVCFSKDGRFVLSGSRDGRLMMWTTEGSLLREFAGHTGKVTSVAFSPNGRLTASGGSDNKVKLWEAATGKLIHSYEGHSNEVNSIAFAPNGRLVASGSDDKSVRIWSVEHALSEASRKAQELRTLTQGLLE